MSMHSVQVVETLNKSRGAQCARVQIIQQEGSWVVKADIGGLNIKDKQRLKTIPSWHLVCGRGWAGDLLDQQEGLSDCKVPRHHSRQGYRKHDDTTAEVVQGNAGGKFQEDYDWQD